MSSRSGQKGMLINTSERAVSTDINRLQAMASASQMELLRWLLDVGRGADDVVAGGFQTEVVTTATPLLGEVIGGLMVVPANGTLQLGVTDGLALVINPDASPSADDSPYKYCPSPTVLATSGTLVLSANSSGFPRIDVIECQRIDDPNPEEDSRDIFNPTTSLFTATTVTKTVASTLQFRVRTGTPNAGFPGVVSGWLPLCVVLVPTATTVVDTCTFWDVRPLVGDRIFNGNPTPVDMPRRPRLTYSIDTTSSQHRMFGLVEVEGGSTRLGGRMERGSPGTDNYGYVDFSDVANQEASMSLPSGITLVYYYLLTPFGLPRWARYTDYNPSFPAFLRFPRSPRGIPLLSTVKPSHVYGIASSPIVFPAAFGFNGASSQAAVCFGATTQNAGVLQPQVTSSGWTRLTEVAPDNSGVAGSGSTSATTGNFALFENTHYPAGAARLRCRLILALAISTGTPGTQAIGPILKFGIFTSNQTVVDLDTRELRIDASVTGLVVHEWDFDVELPNGYPDPAVVNPEMKVLYNFDLTLPSGATIATAPLLAVTGWSME